MADTLNRGPYVNAGALMDGRVEPSDGPSIDYQGGIVANPSFSPANKDTSNPGAIKGWFASPYLVLTDCIPSAISSTTIASTTPSTTAGIALALVTAQAGTAAGVAVYAPGITIIPVGTTVATTVGAIDFGFTTGTTVANSSTVVVVDNSLFYPGQWIVIPGVGASGNTNTPLFTQVQSLSTNTTVITISPVAATAGNNLPIGQGNLHSNLTPPASQFGPANASANAADPYRVMGFGLPFNPSEGSARAVQLLSAGSGPGGTGTFLVSGYDIYFNPMSELITSSGTAAVFGKKAFKYIQNIKSVTAGTTGTVPNLTVGITDIFGFHVRSDKWEYTEYKYGGTSVINSAGWTAALATASSTTTADVRGTINMSTAIASSNGVRRLFIAMSVPLYNSIATPLNTVPILGTAQV